MSEMTSLRLAELVRARKGDHAVTELAGEIQRLWDENGDLSDNIQGWEKFSLAAAGHDPDKEGLRHAQLVARRAERERCAVEVETFPDELDMGVYPSDIAAAIRALPDAETSHEHTHKAPPPPAFHIVTNWHNGEVRITCGRDKLPSIQTRSEKTRILLRSGAVDTTADMLDSLHATAQSVKELLEALGLKVNGIEALT
jgi:hypothetical protein